MNPQPLNPINAVTAPDPYPFYRELIAQRPFYYDERLHLWVASSADAVRAVLTSDLCRVRPAAEPIPKVLIDSPAGNIFGQLVRMNDGSRHIPLKHAISATLGEIDSVQFEARCNKFAEALLNTLGPTAITEFAFQLPLYSMSDLLGIQEAQLGQVAEWVRDYVRCTSPLSTPNQVERGQKAARQLFDHAQALFEGQHGLFGIFAAESDRLGHKSPDAIIANGIGFLSQAYEATAGLIGTTLLTLARRPDILDQVKNKLSLLPQVIEEVARVDAPVQNTRRYIAEDGLLADHAMRVDDAILVILAAANHDPAANANPERFDVFRTDRQLFTFGVGVHACPGLNLAVKIAYAAIAQLLQENVSLPQLLNDFSYQESVNVRIPLFGSKGPG